MSREQSDDEDSVGETGNNRFVDATAESELELCLPLEVHMEPDQICEHVLIFPGPVDLDIVDPSPGTRHQLDLRMEPNRSGPDTGCHCLSPVSLPLSYRGPVHHR